MDIHWQGWALPNRFIPTKEVDYVQPCKPLEGVEDLCLFGRFRDRDRDFRHVHGRHRPGEDRRRRHRCGVQRLYR